MYICFVKFYQLALALPAVVGVIFEYWVFSLAHTHRFSEQSQSEAPCCMTRARVIILHKKLTPLPAGLARCPMYQAASQASNNCQFSLNTCHDEITQVLSSVTFMTRRQNVMFTVHSFLHDKVIFEIWQNCLERQDKTMQEKVEKVMQIFVEVTIDNRLDDMKDWRVKGRQSADTEYGPESLLPHSFIIGSAQLCECRLLRQNLQIWPLSRKYWQGNPGAVG